MELQQDISVCNISSTYELGKDINSQIFRSGHVNGMKEGSRALWSQKEGHGRGVIGAEGNPQEGETTRHTWNRLHEHKRDL